MTTTTRPQDLDALRRAVKLKRLQDAQAVRAAGPAAQPIPRVERGRALPLSGAQQRLWFLAQLDAATGSAYRLPAALRLRGTLDREALRAALDRVVARHEVLRTRFVQAGDEVAQVVDPVGNGGAGFALAFADAADEAAIDAQRRAFFAQPFDLAAGPLARGLLLRVAVDEHVLLVDQHHIVSDGASIGVLVREVAALYEAYSQGRPDPLPPLATQYADYAAWQRETLQGDALQDRLAYWTDRLAGAPALLALPTDRPRPARQSHAGAAVPFALDAGLARGLRALARRHEATPYMTLLAGWAILMGRLSGQEDVVIGSPVANRARRELEDLIGFFANTLALRVAVPGEHTVDALLARMQAELLEAYAHQDLSFEQVVEALRPQRSLAHSPLFQTIVTLDTARAGRRVAVRGLEIREIAPEIDTVHFDTSLTVHDDGESLSGTLAYATALFDASTAERLVAMYLRVLAGMVETPASPLDRLALLSADERAHLLQGVNAASRAFDDERSLPAWFAAQVLVRPDAVAIRCGGESVTYARLDARSNALAHALVARGVGPGSRVVVCLPRGVELVVALLAVLKAGGAYVPVDPDHPAERLAWQWQDCGARVGLTCEALRERLPAHADLLCVDHAAHGEAAAAPGIAIDGASLAYVIYTSGSTGIPKGVMVEHRHVAQLVIDEPCVAFTSQDRVVHCANPAFDASTWDVWGPLLNGASILVVDAGTLLDPRAFARVLEDEGATIVQLTAGLFRQYAQPLAGTWPRLRYVLFGGDQSDARVIQRLYRDHRPAHLVHTYGPTETTAFALTHEVDDAILADAHPVLPIGRPIAHARAYVLDRHGEPVPPGVTGEILIGGAGVARGYLDRPALTAERFVADPFGGAPGARLYRTGDLGRRLADGSIEYLGRTDHQVKVRGFRVELGEIEAALAHIDGVREAVVVARLEEGGEKRLVAYVVTSGEDGLDVAASRAALAQALPEYMVPAAFVRLDRFPLTPNGKLDRAALPAPDASALAAQAYEAPQGPLEEALVAIWQDLLQLDRVGRRDHFFSLGGHSLMAVQVASRVRDRLGVDLPLRELFAHPVLADLAARVSLGERVAVESIPRADRAAPLPLSWSQQRLWFLARLDPAAGSAYRLPAALRLRGRLDRAALRATLDRVVARHEVLRTRFHARDGQPSQVIDGEDVGFALDEVRALDEADAALRQAAFFSRPFDLAAGPLVRGLLMRMAGDDADHVLLVDQHHIVSDGWSVGVLVREVSRLYAAFSAGRPDPLPPLAIQYADHAAWQRGWLQGERLRQQLGYWQSRLAGAPELLALPTDRPRPARQGYAGASIAFTLDADLAAGLRALGHRHGATPHMTLLAGWAILMSRLSGQSDVVIGSPVANRQRGDVEDLIGFFANTLALRVTLEEGVTVSALLAAVRRDTLDAYAHADLPFEQVVDAVKPRRSLSHSPLFQTILSVDSARAGQELVLPELRIGEVSHASCAIHFDTSLTVHDDGQAMHGTLGYATALFDAATAERLVRSFLLVLAGMVAQPGERVDRLALMTPAQRDALVRATNSASRPFTDERSLPAWFAAQVLVRPDAVAIRTGGESVTYARLDARSNALAHALVARGVGPGSRVVVCLPRGVELVVALLAVLKAGGAYVPVDPDHPAERLAWQWQDCGARVGLTCEALRERLPAHADLLCVDHAAHGEAAAAPGIEIYGASLAYVIYTSGSTGIPKGVMVEHRHVAQLVIDEPCVAFTSQDRVVHCANPAFDASTWEVWGPLLNGASILVVDAGTLLDPRAFARVLEDEGATIVQLTAGLFRQYAQPLASTWPRLRYVLFGGDQSDARVIQRLYRDHRPAHLVHTYGPTETTAFALTHEVDDAILAEAHPVLPIGKPIAHARVYLLDPQGEPVPPGVTGEIFVGGAGVGRGYLGRDELTADRFLPDPFDDAPGARLYRTGDLGRLLSDGSIDYQGRDDHQVKIRGFRIELGEIEARLAACEGVREAVVLARQEPGGDRRLVAYVIAAPQADIAAWRAALGASLPDYMVPGAFVRLDAFPLTPNGKLDRAALPAPDASSVQARAYEAPQGPVEAALAALWQDLLRLDTVGRHDHFFALGGHSLRVIEMVERLRALGWELPVQQVFVDATLHVLAAGVRPVDASSATSPARIDADLDDATRDAIAARVPGGAANIEAVHPLTALQQGLLFHSLLDAEGDPYLLRSILAFDSRERLDAFLGALRRVVARHDSLRATMHWDGLAEPLQVVCREVELPIHEHAASTDPGAPDALGQLTHLTDSRRQRLDLHRAPLLACHAMHDPASGDWLLAILNHHLVSDHVSMEVMLGEIRRILRGEGDALPPAVRFADHVARGRDEDRAAVEAAQRAYFRSQLAHVDRPTAPFGQLDVRGSGARLDACSRPLAPALAARVRELARAHGVSPAVLFHVAWAQVLGLCTGQDEVVFGTVLSGRLQGARGVAQVVGLLINTLPLRVALRGVSVHEALRHVQSQLGELVRHEQAPLTLAQSCSGVAPGLPLFSTILNVRHSPAADEGPAWEGLRSVLAEERSNYPLSASITDTGRDFSLTLQAVDADAARVAGWLEEAIAQLVSALADDPATPLSELHPLPEAERHRVLERFNDTARVASHAGLAHRLVERQAARHPDAQAVRFEGQALSYAELDTRANRLAHALVAAGVRPDDRVAICLERGLPQVVAQLAVLKAGAGFVPLDARYPADRLAFIVEDSAPALLLTQASLRDQVAAWCGRLDPLVVDGEGAFDHLPATPPRVDGLTPEHLAYVIYTSGSTGRPKGVLNTHGGLCNLAEAQLALFGVGPGHRVLQFASASFDASVWETVMALGGGATLVLAPAHALMPGQPLLDLIRAEEVTHATLPSSAVMAFPDDADLTLQCLVMAGEACPPALARRWARRLAVFNAYGPSETTVCATAYRCHGDEDGHVPIGRPIANLRVYVLDAHRRPVPVGVPGELYVGGVGVARGYLNRPALTAERFVVDPFATDRGARLYRTGDLGRWRDDGTIEFLGRNDFQVKVRGLRIELGEIESTLARCEGVREAVVVARAGDGDGGRLVAYLAADEGLDVGAVRAMLAGTLPEHMVPAAFVRLDRFPLNANGKLDRAALPAPDAIALAVRAYEAPAGAVEETLAGIWRELLKLDRVGRRDHFFELGGHSLFAVQLASRVRERLRVEMPLRAVFSHPVLADYATEAARARAASDDATIPRADRAGVLPLSWAQQRLWFSDRLDHAASVMYNLATALRLDGPLDESLLRATLDRVVARHESLRTTFESVDGEARQRIASPDVGFALQCHDLTSSSTSDGGPAAREAEIDRHLEAEQATLFDLATGPLVRGRLLRLSPIDHVLIITQHHIVSDGWSIGVLVREVNALYAASSAGAPAPLPPLPVQYADYAQWQRQRLVGVRLDEQLGYWRQRLAGAPALLTLPLDRPRAALQRFGASTLEWTLGEAASDAVRALARRHGCTTFMVLLAGWSVLLSRLSGQERVVIGSGIANREHPQTEGLIGLFVNTLCFHVDPGAASTVSDLLAQVRGLALDAYAHQELPFDQVVEAINPPRSLSHHAVFQAMLSMNETPTATALDLGDLTVREVRGRLTTTAVDLSATLADSGPSIAGSLIYASDLFDAATIARWGEWFATLLRAMAEDASREIADLDMVSAPERARWLRLLDAAASPVAADPLVHRRFEALAAAHPDATALVAADGATLSYAALNAQANRIAHRLAGLGVKADDRVALCVGRNAFMVAGVLGVLKAGAAFVPLDPTYPEARLATLLTDSGPVVLLTEAAVEDRLPALSLLRTLVLDDDPALARQPSHDPSSTGAGREVADTDLAYVIHTSGSTGQPKGVMVEHGGLRNTIAALNDVYAFGPGSRMLQFVSFGFDVCVSELLMPLTSGGTLHLLPQHELLGERLAAHVRARGITHLCLPVAALATVPADADLGALQVLITGGDVLPPGVARRWAARHRVVNSYGPTETTITATTHACAASHEGAVPIGRPLPNVRVYVLDARGRLAGEGVQGELVIGGAGVARGYLGRDSLSAERFLPDPFSDLPGARMYRTGDQGVWRADGTIEFRGRDDHQVKVRGFRIELGEIEARLAACPGVREAVVLARDDAGTGDRRLVGYVVGDHELDVAALRRRLGGELPDYMVPAAFVVLDAFPLTPHGKLDRDALPIPDANGAERGEHEPPQGPLEAELAALWEDLLAVARVGRADHFFDLGGHSLLAVRLMSRIRERRGVDVELRELFEQPTLAAFAERVARAIEDAPRESAARAAAAGATIVPVDRHGKLPLSWSQQRLWFLARLDSDASAAYQMPMALRLQGPLDVAALRATLDRIVARHESLRTRFVEEVDGPVQVIAPADTGFALAIEDLSRLPAEARDAAVERSARDRGAAPFDLAQGPLIRGCLLRLADDEHLLRVDQHHIVSDGWSIGVLLREVTTLYTAFSRGEADPLPPLPIQYADYAAWQRGWLQGDRLEAQLGYWTARLRGAPDLLALPTDRPRPARQDHAGAAEPVVLDAALCEGLRALAQRHGATLYMVLLAGWSLLMARLSGQDEVVIGSPIANRGRGSVEGLIGFFANTLALRVGVDRSASVADLVAAVKRDVLDAQAHQDLPFEQVVEAVNPVRRLAHAPLFQTMLLLERQDAADDGLALADLRVTRVESPLRTTPFDLSLSLTERAGRLQGDLLYATALFDATTIRRWLDAFACLLSGLVADDAPPLGQLRLMTAAQQDALMRRFNDTACTGAGDVRVHQLFEAQARRTPDAVALVFEDHALSYRELEARANRLAHRLLALGVRPDDRVALCCERSLEMVVALQAILKAGAAYVPLDPDQPVDRLAWMLEDSAPRALLGQVALRETLEAMHPAMPVLLLDALPCAWDDESPDAPGVPVSGQHACYVIYTSGSTGRPKGVVNTHDGVVNRLWWGQREYPLGAGDRVLQKTPFGFDVSGWEFHQPLMAGATLVMARPGGHRSPAYLHEVIARERITMLHFVPSMLGPFLDEFRPGTLRTVRRVLCSGEALSYALQQRFLAALPDVELHNLYGPTEAAIEVTAWHCRGDVHPGVVPIGRPIANMRVYLLDPDGQPVPQGVTGELFLAGVGVARGYLNRPELTAERFLDDPFVAGERMYRTGDIGRWLDDGAIEYLGRNDFQVKVRGFRIELGEIESRLLACEGVREAVVVARQEEAGDGKRLVAYLVAESLDIPHLRTTLAKDLPEYMVPSAFVRLDAFPTNASGKLDRAVLPAPDESAVVTREYEAPQGEVEEAIAAIWQELLRLERVGRQDDFFLLGGHSLLAVQLNVRLRERLGVEVPLRDLFTRTVLADFAAALATHERATIEAIPRADRASPLPLSHAQQRLWFLAQLDPAAGAAYRMPAALRLHGTLDLDALGATLDRVVARHESLRTRFVEVDGQAVQAIDPPDAGFALEVAEADERDLAGHQQAFFTRAFDLAAGPLARGRLLRVADDDHVLLIDQHHIVSDGWSVGVLVREVSRLYAAFHEGRADPLPPLALQYADYAAWQRGWLQGERLQAQLAFWRERLRGAPDLLALPTDRPRPARQDYVGASVAFTLDAVLTRELKALARRRGATLYMVLLAGWSVLMSRLSGQDDVVVGSPVANRSRAELEPLIGFFLNTLAMRVPVDGARSVGELVADVREGVVQAQANQDVPFEQVLDAVQPARSLSHNALFQTMLTLDNTPQAPESSLPGLSMHALVQAHESSYCDLYASLAERGDGLQGGLIYATALFDAATIERFAGYFRRVLEGMVADDMQRVDRLPLLDDAERHQQLEEWNHSERPYRLDRTFSALFAERVRAHPDRAAVECDGRALSYAQLHARATHLGAALRAQGVGRDTLVTLVGVRDETLLVMMLAVLHAGAAFLPLDVKHPAQRLREIVAMSGSPLLLVSRACEPQARALAGELPMLVAEAHAAGDVPPTLDIDGRPGDLAYVIFTSGSTGRPKGAMVEQLGMVNHLWGKLETMAVGEHDRLAQTASPAFDICVWQFLAALLVGGCTVVLPDEIAYDPQALMRAVDTRSITLLQTVPSMLRAMLDAADAGEAPSLATLRWLVPTGEALSTRLACDWFDRHPSIPLMNVYGPAECSDDVTYHAITRRPADDAAIPIGRPTPNNRIYLLDRQGQPVPRGVKGEICVGGLGVGRGYLDNPQQTAAAFVAHPFGEGRFYRTGDLGSYRADGTIDFHGRLDFQVKIRGFRIELGEIESALGRCAGIREALVVAREAQGEEKRLVAYVVAEAPDFDVAGLRATLSQSLPEYMVPAAFVRLDRFPLTPNGKLDRPALPAPDAQALVTRDYEAPRGEVEATLAAIWQQLLRVDRVGRQDHFFELGGSSLLATQAMARLRQALDVELPLIQLFQTPVLADLAEVVVLTVVQRFAQGDIEAASADLGDLTDGEIEALLRQERALSQAGPEPVA